MEAATGEVGRSSGKALHERKVAALKNTEYSELAATATGLAQKVEERVNSSPFLFLSSQDLLTFGKPPWKRSHVNCGNNNPWKNINVGGREKGMCEFTPTCDGNCPRQVALSYVLEREKMGKDKHLKESKLALAENGIAGQQLVVQSMGRLVSACEDTHKRKAAEIETLKESFASEEKLQKKLTKGSLPATQSDEKQKAILARLACAKVAEFVYGATSFYAGTSDFFKFPKHPFIASAEQAEREALDKLPKLSTPGEAVNRSSTQCSTPW
jgi:hypothetical protein